MHLKELHSTNTDKEVCVGGGGGGAGRHNNSSMTLNLKNRLFIMHILPGEIRKYITFRHGLSQIVVLHEDSKTDNCRLMIAVKKFKKGKEKKKEKACIIQVCM